MNNPDMPHGHGIPLSMPLKGPNGQGYYLPPFRAVHTELGKDFADCYKDPYIIKTPFLDWTQRMVSCKCVAVSCKCPRVGVERSLLK